MKEDRATLDGYVLYYDMHGIPSMERGEVIYTGWKDLYLWGGTLVVRGQTFYTESSRAFWELSNILRSEADIENSGGYGFLLRTEGGPPIEPALPLAAEIIRKREEYRGRIREAVEMEGVGSGKYYVYVVYGPAGQIIYVGKGSNGRVNAHELEALQDNTHGPLLLKIREIWADGHGVTKAIVYRTDEESLAYWVEAKVIHYFKDSEPLENKNFRMPYRLDYENNYRVHAGSAAGNAAVAKDLARVLVDVKETTSATTGS